MLRGELYRREGDRLGLLDLPEPLFLDMRQARGKRAWRKEAKHLGREDAQVSGIEEEDEEMPGLLRAVWEEGPAASSLIWMARHCWEGDIRREV